MTNPITEIRTRTPHRNFPLATPLFAPVCGLLLLILTVFPVALIAAPIGTGFTYQGELHAGGLPANGEFDLNFVLVDAAAGGAVIGGPLVVEDVVVAGGRFTVTLDFGESAFGAGARWLEISVRPGAGGAFTLLSPRQELTPAPYALALPNLYTDEASDFVGVGRSSNIISTETFGVRAETSPGAYGGMHMESSAATGKPFYGFATNGSIRAWTYLNGATGNWHLHNGGERLTVPPGGGLEIANVTAGTNALSIGAASGNGIKIGDSGSNNFPSYGLFISGPGVSAFGIWSNTTIANGNYAFYSVDNIFAGNVTSSAQLLVAKVSGSGSLEPGDVVTPSGVTDPIPGGVHALAVVQRAGGASLGLAGVVAHRLEYVPAKGKDGEFYFQTGTGPAHAGDYVQLVVMGVAQVKVDPAAPIDQGMRLTAANAPGRARPLRQETLNGMKVSEGTPVIGVALANARGTDTVPVFVTLR